VLNRISACIEDSSVMTTEAYETDLMEISISFFEA
jgi:hypothetical protein